MSVERVRRGGKVGYRVRWREAGRNRARTYSTKRDAELAEAEVIRLRRLGALAQLDAGGETLDEFVTSTWAPIHPAQLSPATRATYAALYAKHVGPYLGGVPLRDLDADTIARWHAERLRSGSGREAVRRALRLVGGILQRAVEHGRLQGNPARVVHPVKRQRASAVRPLAPVTIEAMRGVLEHRDATLISVLAYAGLRPGEALALRWEDVRERTLLVERALSLGEVKTTKTGEARTVRLLAPLAQDLAAWRLRSGRPNAVRSSSHGTTAGYGSMGLAELAAPSVHPGAQGRRRRARPHVRPAAQLREPAARRGPADPLRRPAARARAEHDPRRLRPRHRRARGHARHGRRGRDPRCPRELRYPSGTRTRSNGLSRSSSEQQKGPRLRAFL